MVRSPDLDALTTRGARVRYWRIKRGLSRAELARKIGASGASTVSDLELDRTKKGTFLGRIAEVLKISLTYLEVGHGEPEAPSLTDSWMAAGEPWPLPGIPRSKLSDLNRIEQSYLVTKVLEALAEIEQERRRGKRA